VDEVALRRRCAAWMAGIEDQANRASRGRCEAVLASRQCLSRGEESGAAARWPRSLPPMDVPRDDHATGLMRLLSSRYASEHWGCIGAVASPPRGIPWPAVCRMRSVRRTSDSRASPGRLSPHHPDG